MVHEHEDNRLLFLMAKAQAKLSGHLREHCGKAGVKVSFTQMGILFLLEKQDLRPMGELSKILEIDNSAITRLVDRLEKAGYVARTKNPKDRRQYLIAITEEGRDQTAKAKPVVWETNQKIMEGFSREEIAIFKKVVSSYIFKFG